MNTVEVEQVQNTVDVELVPIKSIILAFQAFGYTPTKPTEGVDMDVSS